MFKTSSLLAGLVLLCTSLQAQSFTTSTVLENIVSSSGIVVHDFNDDGINEIINTQFSQDRVVMFKMENGQFIEEEILTVDGPSRLRIGDYNQDGKDDIAVTAANTSGIRVMQNNGDLEFTKLTLEVFDFEKGREFISEDMDLDGDLDFIIGSPTNDDISIFEMTSPSFLSFDVSTLDGNIDNVGEISSGDFDNDGLPDLVACARFGQDINIYINNGNMTFNKITVDDQVSPYGNCTGDFNNDGNIDFAVADFAGGVILYTNDGNNNFDALVLDFALPQATAIEALDYDNNGTLDLVVSFATGLALYSNTNPESSLFDKETFEIGESISDYYIIDNDNDGDLDIYASSASLQSILLLENQHISLVDNDNDGYSEEEDCDDENADVNPGQLEIPYNGIDDDCNELTVDDDLDNDGFLLADDCDDENASINPNAEDIPNNGIDEDCDGADLVVSNQAFESTHISVFPNPVIDFLTISTSQDLDITIDIINTTGISLLSTKIKTIDVSAFPKGIYFVKIYLDDIHSVVVEKITIL